MVFMQLLPYTPISSPLYLLLPYLSLPHAEMTPLLLLPHWIAPTPLSTIAHPLIRVLHIPSMHGDSSSTLHSIVASSGLLNIALPPLDVSNSDLLTKIASEALTKPMCHHLGSSSSPCTGGAPLLPCILRRHSLLRLVVSSSTPH